MQTMYLYSLNLGRYGFSYKYVIFKLIPRIDIFRILYEIVVMFI